MTTRYIVEEVRATGWSMRLRDTKTGESYDVPLAPGVRFTPPSARASDAAESPAPAPSKSAESDRPAEKRAKPKSSQRKASRTKTGDTAKPGKEAPPSPDKAEDNKQPIDEQTLTTDDRAATEKRKAMLRRSAATVEGKKGGLGWQETTDAGRSGLRARFRAGAFKILHAGGDTYALFYEWDSGKYERIACGAAEDLMEIAAQRAQQELPKPPQSLLDQDLANFYCGTSKPREASPVPTSEPSPAPARPRRVRRTASPVVPEPAPASPPTPAPSDTPVDTKLDETLMASFKQALAELEED